MESNNSTKVDIKRNSRRSFIKKTSIVAGISVLPASNVWGTCNVSGVSGGSQAVNKTCVVGQFNGGYGPIYWGKLAQYDPYKTDTAAIADLVFDISDTDRFNSEPNALKTEGYYPYIRAMLDKHVIQIQGSGRIPPLNVNVGNAMRVGRSANANSKIEHVIAVYINSLFGFINLDAQFTGKDGIAMFIEHIWGSLHEGSYANTMNVLRSSYTSINKISENQLKSILRNNNVL